MKKLLLDALIVFLLPVFLVRNAQLFTAEWFFQQAEKQTLEKNFKSAFLNYRQAAAILPERAVYLRMLGRTGLKLYDSRTRNLRPLFQAWQTYRQLLRTESVYPYNWFEAGLVLATLQLEGIANLPEAETYLLRARAIDPSNPLFLVGWINRQISQGRGDLARPLFPGLVISHPETLRLFADQLLRTNPDRVEFGRQLGRNSSANLEYAQYLFQKKEPALAEQQAARIPEPDRLRPEIAAPLAYLLFNLNQAEPAKQMLARAFERAPANLEIAHLWAWILVKQKDLPGAVAVYRRAIKFNPQAWSVKLRLAQLARQAGEDDLALRYYGEALESNQVSRQQQKDIYLAQGEIKAKRMDLKGALAEFEKALEITPTDDKIAAQIRRIKVQLEYQDQKSNPAPADEP